MVTKAYICTFLGGIRAIKKRVGVLLIVKRIEKNEFDRPPIGGPRGAKTNLLKQTC